jgi:hypothetical protein
VVTRKGFEARVRELVTGQATLEHITRARCHAGAHYIEARELTARNYPIFDLLVGAASSFEGVLGWSALTMDSRPQSQDCGALSLGNADFGPFLQLLWAGPRRYARVCAHREQALIHLQPQPRQSYRRRHVTVVRRSLTLISEIALKSHAKL